jgi:hypothetical protein
MLLAVHVVGRTVIIAIARKPRVIVADCPRHVTHRGNLRADVFFELNPVRAGLVASPPDWIWSSARCHARPCDDPLLHSARPFPGAENDWAAYLARGIEDQTAALIRANTYTNRPTGSREFISLLEQQTGRSLLRQKRGPKAAAPVINIAREDDLFA